MTELLELVLELVLDSVAFFWAWRLYLCLLGSLAVVGGVCELIPDAPVGGVLSIPVVAAGVVGGLVWEHRARSNR